MDQYTDTVTSTFKLNPSDEWLRKRQGLALPVLPPTTPEARQYFFKKVKEYATLASSEGGKGKINYEDFAQEWNKTADGKYRFYVTTELLSAYAKSWEKNGNIRASQDMILDKLHAVSRSAQVFSASTQPFPSYLTSSPHSTQPSQGVLEVSDILGHELPSSISTALALSHPSSSQLPTTVRSTSTPLDLAEAGSSIRGPSLGSERDDVERPTKRRRVIPENERKRTTLRTCRRCQRSECPGNSNILNCPFPSTVPCKTCKRLTNCRGVDKGKKCTYKEPLPI
jgi:hypothetical protein